MYSNVVAQHSLIGAAIWRNRILIGLVALHFLAIRALCGAFGVPFESGTTKTLMALLQLQVPLFLVMLLFWRFGWMAVTVRPRRPTAWFLADLGEIVLDRERILSGTVAFVTMCVFAGSFAVGKDLIPVINPFSWDPVLARIDRALHGGVDPWRLLYHVTGTPLATTLINAGYHLWLMLAYFLIFVACFNVSGHDRHRTYLIADVLCWTIGGNILATVLSSGGPVYYEAFGHGRDFAPLMDTLYRFNETSPVWALHLQEVLLEGYRNGGAVKGISAMPSMHVASTVTMTLYAFSVSRRFGWLMVGFAALILAGSVQLGWHYAIDGYVSILLSLGCWWLARRLVRAFA